MKITEHHFNIQRTARYQLIGSTGPNVEHLFFAFHGHGHLSRYFAKQFEEMASDKTLIVVPEGLHRYYLDKEHKRVGSSWMTREDRLNDISDIILFLNGLHKSIIQECPNVKHISLFGFSQGTATAARWAAKGNINADDLILWAGGLPPDLETLELDRIRKTKLVVALGDQDEFISEEVLREEMTRVNALGLYPHVIRFVGKHAIPKEPLLELQEYLGI